MLAFTKRALNGTFWMILAFARQDTLWQNMTGDHKMVESQPDRKRKRRSEQTELLSKLDSLLPDRARTKTFKSAVITPSPSAHHLPCF